jgi:hypothetical protein
LFRKKVFTLKCESKNNDVRCLYSRNGKSKLAFYLETDHTYYTESRGQCEAEDLDETYYIKEIKKGTLEEFPEQLKARKKDMDQIGKHFGISAFHYCYDEVQLTRAIFYNNVKYLHGCQHVTKEEAVFLKGAFVGPMNYANVGKQLSNGYGYDINSFYPFVMSKDKNFSFPLSEGFIKVTNKKYAFEIKKLTIKGTHKYWVNSKNDYYDNYQVELLNLLNIPYEEHPEEPELCYPEVVRGKCLFSYFDDLYDMKKNGNKHAKLILNSLWGTLSKHKEFEIAGNNLKDSEIPKVIRYIESRNVFILREDQPFKYPFGRIKTYLNSYLRLCLVRDYLFKFENQGFEIYQVKTDGFATNAPPEKVSLGIEMGDLKVEKEFSGDWQVKDKKQLIKLK